jgi:uncharacterized protein
MDLTGILDRFGDARVLIVGGLVIGGLFGFFAQRSRFCLRAAVIEFWRGQFGEKLSVWLLAFSTAVVAVQLLVLLHLLDPSGPPPKGGRGSRSGGRGGGDVFGAGMIMTRGCASRLLVLSANGNLRALLSGLIFAVAAQAALAGMLSPLRETISAWWTVEGGVSRDLLALTHAGRWGGLVVGLVWMAAAWVFALRSGAGKWQWVGGMGSGLAVAAAWAFSAGVSAHSFEPVALQGITFSGPSAEWLMRVLADPTPLAGFSSGLLPGVFLGSLIGGWIGGDLRLEGFTDGYGMRRYIAGAVLMGFGAMLAGGCAVGAGITGGSIFALTAWLALIGMWAGAGVTDRLMDQRVQLAP